MEFSYAKIDPKLSTSDANIKKIIDLAVREKRKLQGMTEEEINKYVRNRYNENFQQRCADFACFCAENADIDHLTSSSTTSLME